MLPLRVRMTLRCSTERMAAGHNADRNIVAVLGALVRGRNAASIQSRKPVRVGSAAVTSAPYTGGTRRQVSGGAVGIGSGQLAAVEIADQRRERTGRKDIGGG